MVAALINLVIYLIVIGLITWLLRFVVNTLPMDEPFRRVANVVLLVISVLIVIVLLLQFIGADVRFAALPGK